MTDDGRVILSSMYLLNVYAYNVRVDTQVNKIHPTVIVLSKVNRLICVVVASAEHRV